MQYSLREDLDRWQERRVGIKLSDAAEDCLTNLRFADDVLLFSTSLSKLRDMLCEFKISTEAVGLGIHPDKTTILSNQDKVKAKEIEVDNIKIEILGKTASARYLGQKITFGDQEREEIKNRLKAAWVALTSKDYRLCHRLCLFSMVVTPTMTYASSTWTLTLKHEKMIKTAQRKMIRLIVQTKRRYKSKTAKMDKKKKRAPKKWKKKREVLPIKRQMKVRSNIQKKTKIVMCPSRKMLTKKIGSITSKRSTKEADEHMEKHNVKCWIEVHRRLKWRMARRITTLPEKRWNRRVLQLASWIGQQHQSKRDKSVDPNEDGKTTSTNL